MPNCSCWPQEKGPHDGGLLSLQHDADPLVAGEGLNPRRVSNTVGHPRDTQWDIPTTVPGANSLHSTPRVSSAPAGQTQPTPLAHPAPSPSFHHSPVQVQAEPTHCTPKCHKHCPLTFESRVGGFLHVLHRATGAVPAPAAVQLLLYLLPGWGGEQALRGFVPGQGAAGQEKDTEQSRASPQAGDSIPATNIPSTGTSAPAAPGTPCPHLHRQSEHSPRGPGCNILQGPRAAAAAVGASCHSLC